MRVAAASSVVRSVRGIHYRQRFYVEVSHRLVLVEVVFVRPRRIFGDRRVVVRRVDTGRILDRARTLAELRPAA